MGWGDSFSLTDADTHLVETLNWQQPRGKLTELQTLRDAEVSTVEFTTQRQTSDEWLGRSFQHHSGNDLLNPPSHPGFWVKKEDLRQEWRIHVWNGTSARVALKVANSPGAHPWVRSHSAGWRLDYGEGARTVRQRHRDVAKAACAALGLDFAAVDVAETSDGRVLALEVNRAPGLEGETIAKYRDKILAWVGAGAD